MTISQNFPRTRSAAGARGAGFAFHGPGGSVASAGPVRALDRGGAASLALRLGNALAGLSPGGLIGGALPFSAQADDALWQAQGTSHAPPRPAPVTGFGTPPLSRCLRARHQPPARDYARMVAQALTAMAGDGGLCKVVLARSLLLHLGAPIDADALIAALACDPAATAFRVALPGGAALIGATPELLISKAGPAIRSFPLAGSARRQADPLADAAACGGLAASDKDRREHAMVVEAIMDRLSPLCRRLAAPEGTGLTATRSMWHLGTRIEGELRDPDIPVPLLAALLHPTPAVCGAPRARAAEVIARLEPLDRGFYAGAVGWCDARGDGAWHVAIRCAEICGRSARLYAGAGIVPGSDPEAEAAETAAKFGAMLTALGLTGLPETE